MFSNPEKADLAEPVAPVSFSSLGRPGLLMPAQETQWEQTLTPERIFQEYAPRIYNLARHMLGSEADAEDVAQEVFVQVLRKLPTFRRDAAFSTWLYRVAVNAALAYRRKRARRQDQRDWSDPLAAFQADGSHRAPVRRWASPPDQLAVEHETHQVTEAAMARLPDVYRDVYLLADVEELSNADIADILDLSVPAIKSRLHRARLLMRNALAPYFEEGAA